MSRIDLNALRREHRAWLSDLELLDRPWLILGSAPNPTIPAKLLDRAARIDINNAGRTASALGLGPADLTIRTEKKSWTEHPDLDTRALLWIHRGPLLRMRWEIYRKTNAKIGRLRRWSRKHREAIVDNVAGEAVAGTGNWGKATTGIAAACYGLFVGVPEVVLCGISVNSAGHSYDDLNRARKQIDEDLFVLQRAKGRPELFTSEPAFAEGVGLRLWSEATFR
jgi:hypothetical protein